ncbi:ubiquitin carboxyl-terminal hydrolase 2 [Cyclospora cayetanensis]|uniref:ubiquitinyl hydrolase 1 n=1 Tax=Cyclospora cayetanensis TaxID=88456 RepID=A0A6P6S3H6_9EIME|nr:ubiquitin carboxyl-terminal hydrolase 2 [Cyclospora cayetanensis]
MASPGGGWCLIESDPGVFCSLVERIGVKGVSFSEVYGLDEGSFESLEAPETNRKILGFVFLFNWTKDNKRHGEDSREPIDSTDEEAPFFATQGPLCVGECESSDWKEVVRKEILRRVEEIQARGEELRFNLLAVTTNPLDNINKALKEAQRTAELAAAKQSGEPLEEGESNCLPSDPKELEQEWERENARRCHDFTPFVLCALRHLAKKGELLKAVHRATEAAAAEEAAAAQTARRGKTSKGGNAARRGAQEAARGGETARGWETARGGKIT